MFRKIMLYYTEGIPSRADFPPGLEGWKEYFKKLFIEMPPGIARIFKIQPISALITGLLVIFLLRRGFEHIPFIIAFIVFVFIYIAFRLYLFKDRSVIMSKVAEIAVMFFINDMLLFILPFYFESTTFLSRNMFFVFVIIGLTVISIWFDAVNKIRRFIFVTALYYALIFFCVLNFVFPIIFSIRNIRSLVISGCISAIIAVMLVYPYINANKNWKNLLKFTAGIVFFLCFLWFGRSLIPPAPLKLTFAAACENVENLAPIGSFYSNDIESVPAVYFFTAIFAPNGLRERITHEWYHNGRKLFTVTLSEIRGGRMEGFRTWSKHTIIEGPGRYSVKVWTAGGQLLGAGSFILRNH